MMKNLLVILMTVFPLSAMIACDDATGSNEVHSPSTDVTVDSVGDETDTTVSVDDILGAPDVSAPEGDASPVEGDVTEVGEVEESTDEEGGLPSDPTEFGGDQDEQFSPFGASPPSDNSDDDR